jgi:hypothetical protein
VILASRFPMTDSLSLSLSLSRESSRGRSEAREGREYRREASSSALRRADQRASVTSGRRDPVPAWRMARSRPFQGSKGGIGRIDRIELIMHDWREFTNRSACAMQQR